MAPKRESGSSSRSSTRAGPSSGKPDERSAIDPLRIGRIGRPHGTEGAFTVGEPTARLELLDAGRQVLIDGRPMEVAWRRGTGARPLVKLVGTDDRMSAEALRGQAIEVPRAALGELAPGEFLVDDLVGCEVVDGARQVGTVRDVLVLPAADVLEVARGDADLLLVPLVSDAVRSVDVAAGRIDIDIRFVGHAD